MHVLLRKKVTFTLVTNSGVNAARNFTHNTSIATTINFSLFDILKSITFKGMLYLNITFQKY